MQSMTNSSETATAVMTPPKVGLLSFLVSEVAFFSTLILAYAIYLGWDTSGPTPKEALSLPLVILNSVFLLSSSGTIMAALKARDHGSPRGFQFWLASTILLGSLFIAGTAYEWYGLIFDKGLTISTNLFGTTFYTLIGFHAGHVTVGLIVMSILLGIHLHGRVDEQNDAPEIISWYWHFVDGVWIIIFLLVYIVGR